MLLKSEIFGYGGVLNLPRRFARMPEWMRVSFHYNTSENFVPETSRVDQYRRPIDSPAGTSRDCGVMVNLWDNNPYFSEEELSFDLTLGYRRRILRDKDWTAQINVRNLQNFNSDKVTVVRRQPDGSPARVRFDPPLQVLLTNTFRF